MDLPTEINLLIAEYLSEKSLINFLLSSNNVFKYLNNLIDYQTLIKDYQKPCYLKPVEYNFITYYNIITRNQCIDCNKHKLNTKDVLCKDCYDKMLDDFGLGYDDTNYCFFL